MASYNIYLVHPGYVTYTDKNEKKLLFLDFGALLALYGVNSAVCINADTLPDFSRKEYEEKYINLKTRPDRNYNVENILAEEYKRCPVYKDMRLKEGRAFRCYFDPVTKTAIEKNWAGVWCPTLCLKKRKQ